MEQSEFVLNNLGINKQKFGRISSFVDFGNVNRWFEKSEEPFLGRLLMKDERMATDVLKLGNFIDLFSIRKYFYYGIDPSNDGSKHIQRLAKKGAGFRTVSKNIQRIKHYFNREELSVLEDKAFGKDDKGYYLEIPKCNFDVEMAVDILKCADYYDTVALFSSDSDFVYLLNYIRNKGKNVILFHSGPTSYLLKRCANLSVNAQRVRDMIVFVKNKFPLKRRNFGHWTQFHG